MLNEKDIEASAIVSIDGVAVSLSDLLPNRIWLQGPIMIEAHYRATLDELTVKFQVRLYKTGACRVRVIVENGAINSDADQTYHAVVLIHGQTVFDETLTHHSHTRWSVEGWNIPDPQTTVRHDTEYLMSTKLVPNYWKPASEKLLNKFDLPYEPMGIAGWRRSMGTAGYSQQIGILPNWDAGYLTSGGDPRSYRAVEAHAKALNSHGIVWSDPDTDSPIDLRKWASWTVKGRNGGGANNSRAGDKKWTDSHHGSGGYLAYLITGDYYYLETLQHQAVTCYLVIWSYRGHGIERRLLSRQTRAGAWSVRTLAQAVSISPESDTAEGLSEWLRVGFAENVCEILDTPGLNDAGFLYHFCAGGGNRMCYSGETTGGTGLFQQNFLTQAVGYACHLQPLADMTNLLRIRDHLYKIPVGLTGENEYRYTRAGAYSLQISPDKESKRNPENWFDSWRDIYQATWGESADPNETELQGGKGGRSVSVSSSGFWGNFLPALSYAVEDGASGAAEGWDRIQNAPNFHVLENSGFDELPGYGIVPRDQ